MWSPHFSNVYFLHIIFGLDKSMFDAILLNFDDLPIGSNGDDFSSGRVNAVCSENCKDELKLIF